MTQGKKASLDAPDNFANGQAINPLISIKTIEDAVNAIAEIGSNDLEDKEIKINTGSAISTTSLLEPLKSGFTRLL
jgi:hypothetical protein